jgi:hypothetical protein
MPNFKPHRVGNHTKASVSMCPAETAAVEHIKATERLTMAGAIRYIIRTHPLLQRFFQ